LFSIKTIPKKETARQIDSKELIFLASRIPHSQSFAIYLFLIPPKKLQLDKGVTAEFALTEVTIYSIAKHSHACSSESGIGLSLHLGQYL
jgi:hypothetical protein